MLFLTLLLAFCVFPTHATAAQSEGAAALQNEELAAQYEAYLNSIPPEVAALLGEDFFKSDTLPNEETLREASGVRAVFEILGRYTGVTLLQSLSLLARICGILLLSAVFRALAQSKAGGVGGALSFCSSLSITVLLFTPSGGQLSRISAFFDTVKGVCLSFLPLMGTLYAMGGNVRAAVVNHSVLSAFLVLLETFCTGSVLPIAGICLMLALSEAVTGGIDLRPLGTLIKRTYTLTLSFLMLLLCGVLGMQSTLAKAGDSLALRTAGFAAGSFLPVVGSSVSQTLSTVAASVEYLRAVAGVGAILVLFFSFLPTFLSIALSRIAFLLGGAVAKLLRCDSEEKILAEFGSVYGYFLAVIASVFVMLIFSLTLFARTAAAR